jgi:hypothetical protein
MNNNPNTHKMFESRKIIANECMNSVLNVLDEMKKTGIILNKSAICRKAGVSENYFSKHKELYKIYDNITNKSSNKRKIKQTDTSKDALIISLKSEIRLREIELNRLKKQINENTHYKQKYESEVIKNKKLENQLHTFYSESLDLDY